MKAEEDVWMVFIIMFYSLCLTLLIIHAPTKRLRIVALGVHLFFLTYIGIWFSVLTYRRDLTTSGIIYIRKQNDTT